MNDITALPPVTPEMLASLKLSASNLAEGEMMSFEPAVFRALVEALEKALAGERRWHRVASRVHEQACDSDVKIDELEKNVAELNSARQRITELEKSHAQVIQSRDHYKRMTEEGLKQLAESRTVTLPKRYSCEGYHIDEAYLQEDPEGDCYDRDEVLEALAAAGIQVIEGEQKNG